MRKITIFLSVLFLFPSLASADSKAQLVGRLERFIQSHAKDPGVARSLARILVDCDHPRVLAAIAATESKFDLSARGRHGEVGAFQVKPSIWGHPGRTWRSQAKKSESVLKGLVSDAGGRLLPALRKYNGTGPAAERYADQVLAMATSI